MITDTEELLQWLGEEQEQADAGSDSLLAGDDFGPNQEDADAELLEVFSGLITADLFTDWTD